jgi:hypothetical protein
MHCAHLQEKLKLLLQSILPARYQALRKVFRREGGSCREEKGYSSRFDAAVFVAVCLSGFISR